MAHTKQTPRNANVDRPTAAMVSDIQPEGRIPLKPTSKNVPMKEENNCKTIYYIKH